MHKKVPKLQQQLYPGGARLVRFLVTSVSGNIWLRHGARKQKRYSNHFDCNSTIAFNIWVSMDMDELCLLKQPSPTNIWELCKILMSLLSHDDQGIMYNFNRKMPIKKDCIHKECMWWVSTNIFSNLDNFLKQTFGDTLSIIQNANGRWFNHIVTPR